VKRAWHRARLRADALARLPGVVAGALLLGLAGAALLSASLGASTLAPHELLGALLDPADPRHGLLWQVRLPRVACGALVGAARGLAGVLVQTAVRNPLADPWLLGVSAGAGAAALVAIVAFPERPALVPAVAFLGGIVPVALLLALSAGTRGRGPLRMILCGVALQALFFALVALIMFFFADRAPAFAAFIVGSLASAGWGDAAIVAVPTALGFALALASARPLDVLLLDESSAASLGLAVRRARFGASAVAALLAAGAVSVAGLVGFVGLVAPNALRLLAGPRHLALLPLAALAGATLVMLADAAARAAAAPLELPVGALLAALGAPYFLFLIRRRIP
jgi:iron complex transport system permease protein